MTPANTPVNVVASSSYVQNDSVADLFDGTTSAETTNEELLAFNAAEYISHTFKEGDPVIQLDPVSSELVRRGEPVQRRGTITLGPVSADTANRGVCLVRVMREVGELSEVVPETYTTVTYNGEMAFCVVTDQVRLYSLDTYPDDWTTLSNYPLVVRTVVMAAALQALDLNDLGSFMVTADRRMVWLAPMMGRHESTVHPIELLHQSPDVGCRFRNALRADAQGFASWVQGMASGEKRRAVENIVRSLGLTTREESKTVDLDFLGRFFGQLLRALPWIQGL